jgi:DNA repair protein RadA/Sms
MAAKDKTVFICARCGHEEPKWLGRCPSCGEWNTFSETVVPKSGARAGAAAADARKTGRRNSGAVPLESIAAKEGYRIDSGIDELNRVLGGGIMKGSSILVGGEPGIGKSTLMLQAAGSLKTGGKILYVTGEESPAQVKMRADRLGIANPNVEVLCETQLERIMTVFEQVKPVLIVIDSAQTLYSPEAGTVPGTVNQIKYCCLDTASWAREHDAAVFFVAHVTKEGLIAGPKVIEHMVDTVLYFEQSGTDVRFLRATKNRFGSTDEVGLFTMREKGLQQVKNPAALFLVEREGELPPGLVVAPVYEGTRVLLVEIQALTVPAKGGVSRTFSDRIDPRSVSRAAAVLEKHAGIRFSDQDIYVNVAGGIRINEVGIELPLAMALYSARTDIAVRPGTTIAGEVSLAGEIRPIAHLKRRIKTAEEMGFSNFIGPASLREGDEPAESWKKVSSIRESIRAVFGARQPVPSASGEQ